MNVHQNRVHIFNQFAIITIGLPFVVFKVLFGILLFRMFASPVNGILCYVLVFWGVVDLVINVSNFCTLLIKKRYLMSVCLLAAVFYRASLSKPRTAPYSEDWNELGAALDVMLSFCIVSIVVGASLFHYLSNIEATVWNVSVVANVLGAGISRIVPTIVQVKRQ
jgi:hypothetical protein